MTVVVSAAAMGHDTVDASLNVLVRAASAGRFNFRMPSN
jgi:hypothetical protein